MSFHSFDPEVAGRVGIAAATLYQHILLWTRKNAVDGECVRDGYVWIRSSCREFSELLPYLPESRIREALRKLVAAGLLIRANHNLSSYDRTSWYALPESAGWLHDIGRKSPAEQKCSIAKGAKTPSEWGGSS